MNKCNNGSGNGAERHGCDAMQDSEGETDVDLVSRDVSKEALRHYVSDFNRRDRDAASGKDDIKYYLTGLLDSMGLSELDIAELLIPTGLEYLAVGLHCESYLSKNDLRMTEIEAVLGVARKGGVV